MRLGKQARDDGAADSDNVLGDVVEALIGALYLEGGLRRGARASSARAWGDRVEHAATRRPSIPSRRCRNGRRPTTASRRSTSSTGRSRPAPCAALRRRGRDQRASARPSAEGADQAGSRDRGRQGAAGEADDDANSCGLVAVVGAPNAGKSTLVNALVGQKVAIVSPKAQTTRTRLMGIAIEGEAQILLLDTPGIFEPRAPARPGDGRRGLGRRAGRRPDRAGGRRQDRLHPADRGDARHG